MVASADYVDGMVVGKTMFYSKQGENIWKIGGSIIIVSAVLSQISRCQVIGYEVSMHVHLEDRLTVNNLKSRSAGIFINSLAHLTWFRI